MIGDLSLNFQPLIPPLALLGLGLIALALLGLAFVRRARGAAWRTLAAALLLAALANPTLVREQRSYHKDVAVVLVDDSPSQTIGDRRQRSDAALKQIQEAARDLTGLELRIVRTGGGAEAASRDTGTTLFTALDSALADVPRRRFAGAILITDGQIHDVPGQPPVAPLHLLLTGHKNEQDRRMVVVSAPAFGLVDRPVSLSFRVEDEGRSDPVPVTLRVDGETARSLTVLPGRDTTVELQLTHGGQTVVELEAAAGPAELTTLNNRSVALINGIRDRLRVLLISGEPHPGERTWRNLLKADPSVDLVHFTILRPTDRFDGTPVNELSLIAFPIRELFEVKLPDFDLIIFDRYKRRNLIPAPYLRAIAQYVENGGALLEVAGPAFATAQGLAASPIGEILPGAPTGRLIEQPFRPEMTGLGRRHPVTQGLTGSDGPVPRWGRWFRQVELTDRGGQALLQGADGLPLLLLDRVGDGRVAQLASDHIWLWTRGYDGGGPQAELLRRLAHWLMKEPALEEEDLTAVARGGQLEITRRSLTPGTVTVSVTLPDGSIQPVRIVEDGLGTGHGSLPVTGPGLYRITDGTHSRVVVVGSANPREYADVRTSAALAGPIVEASGGGVFWLAEDGMPTLRRMSENRDAAGRGWLGLIQRNDFDVTGIATTPLMPGLLVLLAALTVLLLAWYREGR